MNTEGKIILITGASSGIGKACAIQLAAHGAHVILQARGEEALKEVASIIESNGGKASVYPVDLSDFKQINNAAERIKSEVGVPDVIINNAGMGKWLFIEETEHVEIEQMMSVPYFAAFHTTRAFIKEILERNSGHIINVNSPASLMAFPGANSYTGARWALRGFNDALRADMNGTKISVSMLVAAKVSSSYFDNNPGSEERVPKISALFGTLTPEQVAKSIHNLIRSPRNYVIIPFLLAVVAWFNRLFPSIVEWIVFKTSYKRSGTQTIH